MNIKMLFERMEDNSSSFVRVIRIALLILIIIGVGLILTRDTWVPKFVDYLLK